MAYAHVDPREWRPEPRPPDPRPLVVHAPTARTIKGTHHLLAAADALRAEGVDFDLELVEGRTQAEARQVYARADLLVDQLMLGWYGGLAVESMALGVPVIAHVRAADLEHVPRAFARELPIIDATPASIHDVLRTWLVERRERAAGGRPAGPRVRRALARPAARRGRRGRRLPRGRGASLGGRLW